LSAYPEGEKTSVIIRRNSGGVESGWVPAEKPERKR